MSWEKGAVLRCSSCEEGTLDVGGQPRVIVTQYARMKGWRIFEGKTMGGEQVESHICPECGGTPRSKPPKPPARLEEDEPLF